LIGYLLHSKPPTINDTDLEPGFVAKKLGGASPMDIFHRLSIGLDFSNQESSFLQCPGTPSGDHCYDPQQG
jgi:hypothetical protein